jgi:hypothetical protein
MTGLDEKNVAQLEALAADLRRRIGQGPEFAGSASAELQDVEWELEKRQWRRKPDSSDHG